MDRGTTDSPIVVLERDLGLERFSVKHWTKRSSSSLATVAVDSRKRGHLLDVDGADGVETPPPSKVTTAQKRKTRNLGSNAGLTHAAVAREAGRSMKDISSTEPTCTEEALQG